MRQGEFGSALVELYMIILDFVWIEHELNLIRVDTNPNTSQFVIVHGGFY